MQSSTTSKTPSSAQSDFELLSFGHQIPCLRNVFRKVAAVEDFRSPAKKKLHVMLVSSTRPCLALFLLAGIVSLGNVQGLEYESTRVYLYACVLQASEKQKAAMLLRESQRRAADYRRFYDEHCIRNY